MADKATNLMDFINTNTLSLWCETTPSTSYPELTEDIVTEVAIVGAGITGITCALLLKNEGMKVTVVDSNRIAMGTTSHSTAKITTQHGIIYDKLITTLGFERTQQYADANKSAMELIRRNVKEYNIDCSLEKQDAYIYSNKQKYVSQLDKEVSAAKSLGIDAEYLTSIPLPIDVLCAERFPDQAQFHPRRYLLALAEKIPGDGSNIFENTRIMDLQQEGNNTILLTAENKRITAKYVFLASHFPCYDKGGMYFTRLYPMRSYVVAALLKEPYPGGMYITAETPGMSIRHQLLDDKDAVLFGGESHQTGQGEDTREHYKKIFKYAADHFTVKKILYHWSTQDYETPDSLPYAGLLTSSTPNVFMASGFREWGFTNGTASAMIIRDLIIKGSSPWQEAYNPQRFTPAASSALFIQENLDVAKNLIKGKLKSGEAHPSISPGEGKIIDLDGNRAGAYKDENGKLYVVDITCTHLGCELSWNAAEKTWDCPCHGSRFSYDGTIIEGPAVHQLKHLPNHEKNEIDPNIT
jgi:glycine/D-amino acid oxidase-like deaminating enzyme/nitrite reductase/ring-hydroxylating ferredoxin subunit